MHLPIAPARLHDDHDDDRLLETIAVSMARIDPRSLSGAPVLIADLRPHLARHLPGTADFFAALFRLERSARLTLIRRDPAFPAVDAAEIVSGCDGLVEVIGVALR